jgi:hypothetical protein
LASVTGISASWLVIWLVLGDEGMWWIVGALVLAAVQLMAAVRATLVERCRVTRP